MRRIVAAVWVACIASVLIDGCRHEPATVMLATTTSVDNSGLLAHLAPIVKRDTDIEIRWVAVGSGKAIRMARDGRVVATLTHDPDAEGALVASGRVKLYRQFMRNDFVVVGPSSNPAGINADDDAVSAFRKISQQRARFCSRADQSGTHSRELKIWRAAGIDPTSPAYFPLGQSMSALLRSASELGAYTLTDRATFRQLEESVALRELVTHGSLLENIYAITLMKPEAEDDESRNAAVFAAWILSPRGSAAIASFPLRGKQQFFPIGAASRTR
jgi:tungstate transport system substrate-binding protein